MEVAKRIPQEVVEDLRRGTKGQLRIKFRVTDAGVLFGWDIERRPGYEKYSENEIREKRLFFPAVYSMTGGDFREARGFYVGTTRHIEKGWYLDKRTGQKIETDF